MERIWFLNFQLSNSHYCLISILWSILNVTFQCIFQKLVGKNPHCPNMFHRACLLVTKWQMWLLSLLPSKQREQILDSGFDIGGIDTIVTCLIVQKQFSLSHFFRLTIIIDLDYLMLFPGFWLQGLLSPS